MESNTDKQLRDKLKGVEFPFDPQAWEKMEAMLDEKKKRRGFFWWWTGGIAAALLLGALLGYEAGVNNGKWQVVSGQLNTETNKVVAGSSKQLNTNSTQSTDGGSATLNTSEQSEIADKNQEIEKGNKLLSDVKEQKSETGKLQPNKNRKLKKHNQQRTESTTYSAHRNLSAKSSSTAGGEISNGNETASVAAKNAMREKRKNSLLQKSKGGGVNTTIQAFERNVTDDETQTSASTVLSNSSKNALAESIELNRMEGLLQASLQDENSIDKTKDELLPKKKKKIFNYSLGVLANLSGTTVGSQSDNRPERPPLFYNKPSYAVGFTHEFLFLNRIAISNSILYSQTGFKVHHPSAPQDSATRTKSYSSAISELQIPIGIKAYPVVKKHFRFSIAAGIINHIKLKEVFTVEKETPQTIPSNIVTMDNTFVSVNNNSFSGMESKSVGTMADGSSATNSTGEYFGMGGISRYYASFYASAGVEVIAKKHFIFFTEPMFYMSLNKIGLQDKRKYNVGVSGGFRYQF